MQSRKKFLLRVDPALYRELEAWAHQEFRSVNGQIEYVLREAVGRRKGSGAGRPQEKPQEPPATAGG